jgi:hypothetical protein
MTLGGGREAIVRLSVISAGVMVGVALLLFMISGLKLLSGTWQRPCWRCTGQTVSSKQTGSTNDALHWRKSETTYNAKTIEIYDIAQTGPNSPNIPGIKQLPGPGEYYASPKLVEILQITPDNQLDDRFSGKLIGTIGREGLDGPKDLIIIAGHNVHELPLTPVEPGHSLPLGSNGFTYKVWKVYDQPLKRDYGPFIMSLFGEVLRL